jgi:hypothetical protein
VASALEGDPEPMLARELDDRDDIAGVFRIRDGNRPLVDGQVPGQARGVEALVPTGNNVAGEPIVKRTKIHGRVNGRQAVLLSKPNEQQ